MKLEINDYIRIDGFISKIDYIKKSKNGNEYVQFKQPNGIIAHINSKLIEKASHNITDLIEYMDLLEVQNPIKLYGKDAEISFFNPVRCDGFTTFEDGTHCIILDLDYFVDVKDLKIKSILTHESFESNCYEIGDE